MINNTNGQDGRSLGIMQMMITAKGDSLKIYFLKEGEKSYAGETQ
jgi:hypothetical protein